LRGQRSRPATSRSLPTSRSARSTLLLHRLCRFAPAQAASMLLARCKTADQLHRLLFQLPLPFGTLTSLQIKAFRQIRNRSARLPNPPDSLSLPAAGSISRVGYGSSFLVRYVSGGLLFLKPLGTSFTMLSGTFLVNRFCAQTRRFQQYISGAFSMHYRMTAVQMLWIKRGASVPFLPARA